MTPYRTPGPQSGPGGTSGGVAEFLIGLAMLIAGVYLFLDSVQVISDFYSLFGFGTGSFGLSLLPLFVGVAFLFFDGRSKVGWLLTVGGRLFSRDAWSKLEASVVERLRAFHASEPLRGGMSRENLRAEVAGSMAQDVWRELHPDTQSFSWWDYRGGAFHRKQGLRIDLLLVTRPVLDRVRSVEIDRDYRKKKQGLIASDHAPVWADLEDIQSG